MSKVKWVDILPGIRMEVRDGGIRFEVYDVSSIQVGKEDEVLENGIESLPPGIIPGRFASKEQMITTSQGGAMLITYFTKLPPRNEKPFNTDPHLTDSEREFLITGFTEKEWDVTFTLISDLELSTRATNCLAAIDVKTIEDLSNCNEQDLLLVKNFNNRCLKEVKEVLESYGLELKTN